MLNILIVEDDPVVANAIFQGGSQAGYACDCVHDGMAAADAIDGKPYDLVLLDVMIPGVDGFELMEYIRPAGIPVIFITAKSAVQDRVKGLRLGADDYIVKPFEMVELIARIEAVMKRYQKGSVELSLGDVTVNTQSHFVTKAGQPVHLKTKEFDLLVFLLQNRGLALFRETIYERVWQKDFLGNTRTVDLHILRLRQKLGWEDRLVTLNRIGYRLDDSL
ncbi:MAG: response regulator transcription factor [Proteobacteria bacterium]|nr:response regulator transcription factor [Pseudomonadota bacterium]